MSEGWGAELNGVYLSGGDGTRKVGGARGSLTVPPDGLGLPELSVDDFSPLASDGTVRDPGFYPGRVVTLSVLVGGGCGPAALVDARQRVADISQAWSRACEDIDLTIYAPPMPVGTDREIAGPYVVRGKPRACLVSWRKSKYAVADMTLRFDGSDHLLGFADATGVRDYDCITVPSYTTEGLACAPFCFTGPGMCFAPSGAPPPPNTLDNDGTTCVPIVFTFTGDFPEPASIEITLPDTSLRTIVYNGQVGGTPVTLDTSTGRATDSTGEDLTNLFSGDVRLTAPPGVSSYRLRSAGSIAGTLVTACINPGVLQA